MNGVFYEVKVQTLETKPPFGTSTVSRFNSLEDARKCADIWKEKFNVSSKIVKFVYDEVN